VTTNRLLAAQLKDKMWQQDLVNLLMSTGLTNQEFGFCARHHAGDHRSNFAAFKKEGRSEGQGSDFVTD
jgi:hypothetical protein